MQAFIKVTLPLAVLLGLTSAQVIGPGGVAVGVGGVLPVPVPGGVAGRVPVPGYGYYGANDVYAYPRYLFNYGVQDRLTGDFKVANEQREGAITRGSYSFLQPDGILRTVNYVVDPIRGFQAQVLNRGVSRHPGPAISYRQQIQG